MSVVMRKDVTEMVARFRKSKTTHDLLWAMYHNSGFKEEKGYGFSYDHSGYRKSGLQIIMPQEFYKLWNGSWLDPAHRRQMTVDELQEYLSMKIDCRLKITVVIGHLMDGPDGKAWFMLPGLVENWNDELTDVLLTAEWNVMDDLEVHPLSRTDVETAVGEIRYWHEVSDPRKTDGKQYIVLPVKCFKKLKNIWTYEWKQLLAKSNQLLDEFDAHKAEYKEKFATEVIPLIPKKKSYSWKQTDDDTVITWKNAWDDTFPHRFLHDEIGWQSCIREYDFLAELRK